MGGWIPSYPRGRLENAVEALIPPARCRTRPIIPLLAAATPEPAAPADARLLVLDLARLDTSGRFTSRTVMAALHWEPHQPLELDVAEQAVLFTVAVTGDSPSAAAASSPCRPRPGPAPD